MTFDEARKLANALRRESDPRAGRGLRTLYAVIEQDRRLAISERLRDDRIVFMGGPRGAHSLSVSASSPERVLAHWEGYVEAAGMKARPEVGQSAQFFSGSASRMGGYRNARVVRVGRTRALLHFKYKTGRESEVWVPFSNMRF